MTIMINGEDEACFGSILDEHFNEDEEFCCEGFCLDVYHEDSCPFSAWGLSGVPGGNDFDEDDGDLVAARVNFYGDRKDTWDKVIQYYTEILPDYLKYSKDEGGLDVMCPAGDTPWSALLWALHDIRKISEWPGLAGLICELIDDGLTAPQALSCTYGLMVRNTYDRPVLLNEYVLANHGSANHILQYQFSPSENRAILDGLGGASADRSYPSSRFGYKLSVHSKIINQVRHLLQLKEVPVGRGCVSSTPRHIRDLVVNTSLVAGKVHNLLPKLKELGKEL